MNVDSRLRVCPFGHHSRYERDSQFIQKVGQAIDSDRLDSGIAKDDFIGAAHGRVAVVGGANVESQHLAQLRQLFQK